MKYFIHLLFRRAFSVIDFRKEIGPPVKLSTVHRGSTSLQNLRGHRFYQVQRETCVCQFDSFRMLCTFSLVIAQYLLHISSKSHPCRIANLRTRQIKCWATSALTIDSRMQIGSCYDHGGDGARL